ncbi:MAG: glutamyl-tRNA reductase [Fusobacteriaceae bacterium]
MYFKNFIVIGISHKELNLEERENFIKMQPIKKIEQLYSVGKISGYVNLTTCLRVEIYIHIPKHVKVEEILDEFKEYKIFHKNSHEAVNYLFRVACGFESIIKGEDQILAQIKKSHFESMESKVSTSVTNVIFNKAIELGKKFRHHSKICHNSLSLEGISLKFIKSQVESIEDKKILLLGLGELSESIMKLLLKEKCKKITITNRSRRRTEEIQQEYPVSIIDFQEKTESAAEHDIIISATSAPHYIIQEKEFVSKMKEDKNYIFLDLAVPRDIEENLNNYSNIKLYNLDDVWGVYYKNLENRENLLYEYEYLLAEQIESLNKWFRYRGKLA